MLLFVACFGYLALHQTTTHYKRRAFLAYFYFIFNFCIFYSKLKILVIGIIGDTEVVSKVTFLKVKDDKGTSVITQTIGCKCVARYDSICVSVGLA